MPCLPQAQSKLPRVLAALSAALLLALVTATLSAEAYEPVGADFRISTTGSDGDATRVGGVPDIAYNPAANQYLVVWHANAEANDDEFEVYGQRLSANGTELAGDFRISVTGTDGDPARDAAFAAVAYNSVANEYLVTWQGDHLADENFEIFGQRLSATGASLGANFRISNSGGFPAAAFVTDLAYNPARNEYLVVWSADPLATDNDFEIFGQRVSGAGAEIGSELRYSTTGPEGDAARDATLPAVAYNSGANEYQVTWQADALATDEEWEIYAQRVSATGSQLGQIRVSEMGGTGDAARAGLGPAIAYSEEAGEYLIAWSGDGLATDDEHEIFTQRVVAEGLEIGLERGADTRLSTTGADGDPARDAEAVALTYNPVANEYLAGWRADGLATDDEFEVFGMRLGVTGAGPGAEFRISNMGADGDTDRDVSSAAIAANSTNDEYLAAWHGDGLATDDEFEVFGRRLGIVPAAATPTPGESPRNVRCRGERPTILGTPEPETLRGSAERDVIIAGAGDDVVVGLDGDDLICAGEGSDELRGDGGDDEIVGRDGRDELYGGGGEDHLQGGEGGDKLFGEAGTDVLIGTGSRDAPVGRASRDACRGGGGGDLLLECGPRSRVD